jgi:hypothetical protein
MYEKCPPTSRMGRRITKAFLPFCPLSALFPPLRNCLPQDSRSLQDLRCSNLILISSTKTREPRFPRLLLPSCLVVNAPHSFHFSVANCVRFHARRSHHRFIWSCFDHKSFPVSAFMHQSRAVTDIQVLCLRSRRFIHWVNRSSSSSRVGCALV